MSEQEPAKAPSEAPEKTMQRRALIVSAAAALATAVLFRLYLARLQAEVAGGPATQILVLARDLPVGETLAADALTTRPVPQAHLESRHVPASARDEVLGQRLSTSGKAGEALLWTDLASMHARTRQLSTLVPEGLRAVAVSLGAGRFDALLRPGDRVDVLCTTESATATRTELLLQNVLVLAVGRDLGGAAAGRRSGAAGVVTLGVRLDQARQLADAEARGSLRLALRNPDDILVEVGDATSDARGATGSEP